MRDRLRRSGDGARLMPDESSSAPGKRTLTAALGRGAAPASSPSQSADVAAAEETPTESLHRDLGRVEDPFALHLLGSERTVVGPPESAAFEGSGAERDELRRLRAPLFAGDARLEACLNDRDRLTMPNRDASVLKVKKALIQLGYDLGERAGSTLYDHRMWTQVQKFKIDQHLYPQDWGDVGPKTMERLDELLTHFKPVPPPHAPGDVPMPRLPEEPTPLPKSKKFRIRFMLGLSGGAGPVAGDGLDFEIADRTNNLVATYHYVGVGVGGGAFRYSGTGAGEWTDFTTEEPITVAEFFGLARFSTAGVGPWSKSVMHIPAIAGNTWGVYVEVSTGLTLGGGASTTIGVLVRKSNSVRKQ